MKLTFDRQDDLIRWAEPRMGVDPGRMPAESVAMGVLDDACEIQAVIVVNAFYAHYCSMHIASNGRKRWASRTILALIFGYVFDCLKCRRINALVSAENIPAQIMALHLGFRFEGATKCGADDGTDGVLFGMTREMCRWIGRNGESDGQGRTED